VDVSFSSFLCAKEKDIRKGQSPSMAIADVRLIKTIFLNFAVTKYKTLAI
jgi:hypothetical protein